MNKNTLFNQIIILLTASFLVFFIIYAWTEPGSPPPEGNVPAPINTSDVRQRKIGTLRVGGLTVDSLTYLATDSGNVGIGTTSPAEKLHVVGQRIKLTNTNSSQATSVFIENDAGYKTQFGVAGSNFTPYQGISPNDSFIFSDIANSDLILSFKRNIRFYTSTGERMRIDTAGNVGIGTTAPATKLEVQGGAFCVRSGTGVSCNTTSGAVSAQYFYYISDLRLKTNIQPIENALSRLLTLDGVSYQTKYDNARSLGLIAQDVEKVFPEVVNTDKETGLKWIDYGKLVPVLIEAIKEQQREIESLKIQLESLQTK